MTYTINTENFIEVLQEVTAYANHLKDEGFAESEKEEAELLLKIITGNETIRINPNTLYVLNTLIDDLDKFLVHKGLKDEFKVFRRQN